MPPCQASELILSVGIIPIRYCLPILYGQTPSQALSGYVKKEVMRPLTEDESASVALAERVEMPHALVHLTRTILEKSYWDATEDIRRFLRENSVHDYSVQAQGPQSKRYVPAAIVMPDGGTLDAPATLYRPLTKQGDPRMWLSRLNSHASADDVLLLTWSADRLWAINLTKTPSERLGSGIAPFSDLFAPRADSAESLLEQLLEEMVALHQEGFIPAMRAGDTAVGHLLESRLGIAANSRQAPDYMDVIELKSTRASKPRGHTLFANVADWAQSPLKSSNEILEVFGYEREKKSGGREFALNCSVDTIKRNSQGLRLEVREELGVLLELSDDDQYPIVAQWSLEKLKSKLASKHKNTLWVSASSERRDGLEYIRFDGAHFRSQPVLPQLIPLLQSGAIYMDHLISRPLDKSTAAREAGPLFKIRPQSFDLLFPKPRYFDFSALS